MKHHKGGRRRGREAICKPHCLASDEDRYYMKHHKGGGGRRRRGDAISKLRCLASDEDRYYMKHHKGGGGVGGGGEGGMPYVNPTAWHLMRTGII